MSIPVLYVKEASCKLHLTLKRGQLNECLWWSVSHFLLGPFVAHLPVCPVCMAWPARTGAPGDRGAD